MTGRILAADIGGTNSRFAEFLIDDREGLTEAGSVWMKSHDADSLEGLLDLLQNAGWVVKPDHWDAMVFAVPGPVRGGVYATLANVSWPADISGLVSTMGRTRVGMINDFEAQAFACRTPAVADALIVQPGEPDPTAALAVVGAGTGLGHCALVPDGRNGFISVPSEAGQAAFCLHGPEETAFMEFALRETREDYPYGDLMVTGTGLTLIHQFLTGERLAPEEIARRINPESPTSQWFARFYARACRNYALTVLSFNGLYITGGIAAGNPYLVNNDTFRTEFHNSPAYVDVLSKIPIYLNINPENGLWGAAFYGLLSLRD